MSSFLCDENIADDKKIQKLITEFGESAGFVFIRLLAHVKKAQDSCYVIFTSNQWFRKFVAEGVTDLETIEKIFSKLAELELIDSFLYNNEGIIFLPKYIKRHANYFKQAQRRSTYSGKVLLENLESGFYDREHKNSFSLTFNEFVLVVSKTYLRYDLDLRISTIINSSTDIMKNKFINNISTSADLESVDNLLATTEREIERGPIEIVQDSTDQEPKKQVINPELAEKPEEHKELKGFEKPEEIEETTEVKNPVPDKPQNDLEYENRDDVIIAVEEYPPKKNPNSPMFFRKGDWCLEMTYMLREHVKKREPKLGKPNVSVWATQFFWIRKQWENEKEIEQVLNFSQQNEFWRTIVFAPNDLQRNYAKIKSKMLTNANPGNARCTYTEMCNAVQKYNRQFEEFILCIDETGEKIYWDTKKGACPYEEYKSEIVKEDWCEYASNPNDSQKAVLWNITQNGIKLPEGWYYTNKTVYEQYEKIKVRKT